MHLHFEEPSSRLRCDSVINSLSWMGRVPDEQPEGHGWKLNRTSYYQEGWLATGNVKSVVGVTFTSTLANRSAPNAAGWCNPTSTPAAACSTGAFQLPLPPRTNYNLRGHRAQISLVRWNEPYQKLATCDESGIIFVWIRYEGRWSIELINDRNRPVTHFSWSHDGRMAVIAYQDGFVLVGSVAGQRYWSTFLSQDYVITAGTWTPDDQQVYLGTSTGMIVVLDVRNGDVIAEIQMPNPSAPSPSSVRSNGTSSTSAPATSASPQPSWSPSSSSTTSNGSHSMPASGPLPCGIRQLAWNCPRFKMEEPANAATSGATNNSSTSTNDPSAPLSTTSSDEQHVLAVLTFGGQLSLIKGFDDVQPCYAVLDDDVGGDVDVADVAERRRRRRPGPLASPMMEWNNDGELLCLAGHYASPSAPHYVNELQFFNSRGALRYRVDVPHTQAPITSITWGHNDRRLFVATGCTVHVAWVSPRRMASLQHLARLRVRRCLASAGQLDAIAERLPSLMRSLVATLFNSTIHCHVPEEQRIRDFVCRPPPANTRLYCTMIRRDDESASNGDVDPALIDPNAASGNSTGSGVAFTLYLEFLGGLIPLLKGKPTSRLRPEFVILDPQQPSGMNENKGQQHQQSEHQPSKSPEATTTLQAPPTSGSRFTQLLSPALQRKFRRQPASRPAANITIGASSDSETEESCVSTPRLQRKFGAARKHHQHHHHQANQSCALADGPTAQTIEAKHPHGEAPLAEIASNIWGTRFKITGFPPSLPASLGQVTYKTSLLHLQPRQMTLGVVDLRDPQPGDASSSEDNSCALSDDDDGAAISIKENEAAAAGHLAPIAPLATPNLRLRRKAPRRLEPPPAPTHHRRPVDPDQVFDEMVRMEWSDTVPERVVLSAPVVRWRSLSAGHIVAHRVEALANRSQQQHKRRKSRSLDSSPVTIRPSIDRKPVPLNSSIRRDNNNKKTTTTTTTSASFRIGSQVQQTGAREKHRFALARLSPLFGRKLPSSNKSTLTEPNTPNSSPAVNRRRNNQTAATKPDRRQSPIRQLLNSPLLARRFGRNRFNSNPQVLSDSSDEDNSAETPTAFNYHDLESFQKAQLLNKLKQTWMAEKGAAVPVIKEAQQQPRRRREFVLNNKAPLWNEHSQVYQLDFGGRVTQESAKNFQIEFKGKQVMQFGRIDGNAYTLDFQYPFSAVQAFAVALANVTQRLK